MTNEQLFVENIVKYAAPDLKIALMVRYNLHRQDYMQHSQELIAWAQELEDDAKKPRRSIRSYVNSVNESKPKGLILTVEWKGTFAGTV